MDAAIPAPKEGRRRLTIGLDGGSRPKIALECEWNGNTWSVKELKKMPGAGWVYLDTAFDEHTTWKGVSDTYVFWAADRIKEMM